MKADIFCRVVDNFGDIGVCWRLARRLSSGAGWSVRLWVDDLPTFQRLQADVEPDRDRQQVDAIEIIHWTDPAPDLAAQDVVIEAFACDPPPAFLQSMQERRPLWINLEYLTAESWAPSFHALSSTRADGLRKFFFFPGFLPATGGLLREPDLLAQRDLLQESPNQQRDFLASIGLTPDCLGAWQRGARLVSLFCYPDAPLESLLDTLSEDDRPTVLVVPGQIAPELQNGPYDRRSRLRIARVPFLTSGNYDRLLWCCDVNFVRGEDSLVRAVWAGKPLVWHIYPQHDGVHADKLDAWLSLLQPPPEVQSLIRAWNRIGSAPASESLRRAFGGTTASAWWACAQAMAIEQSLRPDLGDNLANFCADQANKR